jgi:hypothetical protein
MPGLNIKGATNSVGKGISKGIQGGINSIKRAAGFDVDLENPDGVQSQLTSRNTNNSLKSNQELDNNLNIAGVSGDITVENVGTDGSKFYTNLEESVTHTIPDGLDGKTTGGDITIGPRPFSLFSKYSLVDFRGSVLNPEGGKAGGASKHFNKIDPSVLANPTASKIIQMTEGIADNYGYAYSYSDFALTRYFGKIPNNMMITLRRFSFPCPDDIISPKSMGGESVPQPDIARAITWMGESTGNNLSDIMKFSHGFNWKEAEAKVQTLQSQTKSRSGTFGARIAGDRLLSAAASAAQGKDAYETASADANAGYDSFTNTYPNHVFGPINVINKVLMREQGMTFNQEFSLKFEYELRDLGGSNPKILMMDQLANILALTYNNAPFWGGAVRYIGDGSITKPLGDIEKIRNGDFGGFMQTVLQDITKSGRGASLTQMFDNVKDGLKKNGIGKVFGNLLGGGLMKMFNTPQGGQAVQSLLTGDSTGQWHVTIGNPLNPIAVMGNMACTDTEVNFEGAMGPNDFPERMVVIVKLKPARPRDKAEIESMFNLGRGRFYIQPSDSVDINAVTDVDAYGKTKGKNSNIVKELRKLANG